MAPVSWMMRQALKRRRRLRGAKVGAVMGEGMELDESGMVRLRWIEHPMPGFGFICRGALLEQGYSGLCGAGWERL